jgi:hypothetical protein
VKKILISLGSVIVLGLPMIVMADFDGGYVNNFFVQATQILKNALLFLVSLAVVWFIWNVTKYAMSDDEGKKGEAKGQMIHGIIAIAVIVSVWGLVYILQGMFLGDSTAVNAPNTTIYNLIPTSR